MTVKNKLGLGVIFTSACLAYLILLIVELPKLRFEARIFPEIFITITFVFGLLKILLDTTNSKYLRELDNLSLVPKVSEAGEENALVELKQIEIVAYILAYYFTIYLLGYLVAVPVCSFFIIYKKSKNITRGLLASIILILITYSFVNILPGGLWEGLLWGILS